MAISQATIEQPRAAPTPEATWPSRPETPELPWRVLSLLNAYRILVTITLLGLFYLIDTPRVVGGERPVLFLFTAFAYLLLSVAGVYTLGRRMPGFRIQLYAQIALDILAITTMMHASGGVRSGLGNLLVVSIGAASLTVMQRTAGLFAALATLAVLFEQSLSQLKGITTAAEYTPTGLLGAIIFVIALAAQPLARRIRESEALARQRGVDLENLAELNDYIIQHLRESIVVVDGDDRVRLMNESAAKILGVKDDAQGRLLASISPRLQASVDEWRRDSGAPPPELSPLLGGDGSTLITPHVAPLGKSRPSGLLVFLEDASLLVERVQQSKLAALGRLSASIAHEIRNPVGAMSHAGQLLAESPVIGEDELRLTHIIHQNAERISTIIENVLQLSRRESTDPERLTLASWLGGFADEFNATNELARNGLSLHHEDPAMEVRMDPSHLHQVLWNLCDNGIKYAPAAQGRDPVELKTGRMPSNGRPFLEVADRGPGIDASVVGRMFEPFFTSASGGTGLGLFIARQLCECNGATLTYEPRPGGGSLFRIVFADPARWAMEA